MNLVFIYGPVAVGKMTVGNELSKLTGFKLFHNHMTIDAITPVFSFETPQFRKLVNSFRKQIFKEVAESNLSGIIFTFCWAFNHSPDQKFVQEVLHIFKSRGRKVYFVELEASQQKRLERNRTEFRLSAKASKRDVKWSDNNLVSLDENYQLNSTEFPFPDEPFVKINNENLPADEVARQIQAAFSL